MIDVESFLGIADLLPEPMFLINRQGKIVSANTPAMEILGYRPADNPGLTFQDVVCDPKRKINEYLRACFRSAELVLGAVDLRSMSGDVIAARVEGCLAQYRTDRHQSLVLLRCLDKRKSNARFLALNDRLDEITRERLSLYQSGDDMRELQRLALVDSLTSLPNRRSLDKNLDFEWKRASREGKPLSTILLDIDFFKAFNDTYGHLAGDGCLKEVARTVQIASQRPADLTARYGGEEFAVLLPATEREGAVIVAERIRKEVERLGILHAASDINDVVTVSLGVATIVPTLDVSPLELLSKADKALYQAKAAGRNRVHIWGRALPQEQDEQITPTNTGKGNVQEFRCKSNA
ncbi:MAG: diguanylate cyclase [Gammaproteobacteria bacterium]|nr:diguanylate cyclase [Gammaproteobacteria bacterium]